MQSTQSRRGRPETTSLRQLTETAGSIASEGEANARNTLPASAAAGLTSSARAAAGFSLLHPEESPPACDEWLAGLSAVPSPPDVPVGLVVIARLVARLGHRMIDPRPIPLEREDAIRERRDGAGVVLGSHGGGRAGVGRRDVGDVRADAM